ncbi:MAG: hypothetical protein NW241_14395 [Bacteroidia bacterium]|nr:hypothetical protein [Bacteroidia bacterium]
MRHLLRPLTLICWLLCGLGSAWAGGGGVSALMAASPHQGFDTGSTNPNHRYGFQGEACPERSRRESDDKMYGDGNAIAFTYRVHACPERSRRDPRIGRFLSVDPLAPEYPWNSPYAFSENRVLDGVELEGLEYYSSLSGPAYLTERLHPETAKGLYNRARNYEVYSGLGTITGGAIVATVVYGPYLYWWAASNPAAAGEMALEMFNPSAVGAFGVGGLGMADEVGDLFTGSRSLYWDVDPMPMVKESITIPYRWKGATDNMSRKLFSDPVIAQELGSLSYHTPVGMLDVHAHGLSESIVSLHGPINAKQFAESLGSLDGTTCINLFTCFTASGSFASSLAKETDKYVGGMTVKWNLLESGEISMPPHGLWRTYNSAGIVVDEFRPADIQTIIARTQQVTDK